MDYILHGLNALGYHGLGYAASTADRHHGGERWRTFYSHLISSAMSNQ
jgi:hypothetical protein